MDPVIICERAYYCACLTVGCGSYFTRIIAIDYGVSVLSLSYNAAERINTVYVSEVVAVVYGNLNRSITSCGIEMPYNTA